QPDPAVAARNHRRGPNCDPPRPVSPLRVPPSPQETEGAGGTATDSSSRPCNPASGRSRDGHTGTRTGQESLSAVPHPRERGRRHVFLLRIQVPKRSEAATVRISRTGKASHNTLPKRNDASPPVPCIPGPTARDFPLLANPYEPADCVCDSGRQDRDSRHRSAVYRASGARVLATCRRLSASY